MGDAATRILGFDELYAQIDALRPGLTGEILEPGVIRTMSRPGRRHRRTHKLLFDALGAKDLDRGGQGWWIELEPEVRLLDELLVVPDLAGWRVDRVPELPDENPLTLVPDWVCEVLSSTTERDDRRLKLPLCGWSIPSSDSWRCSRPKTRNRRWSRAEWSTSSSPCHPSTISRSS